MCSISELLNDACMTLNKGFRVAVFPQAKLTAGIVVPEFELYTSTHKVFRKIEIASKFCLYDFTIDAVLKYPYRK